MDDMFYQKNYITIKDAAIASKLQYIFLDGNNDKADTVSNVELILLDDYCGAIVTCTSSDPYKSLFRETRWTIMPVVDYMVICAPIFNTGMKSFLNPYNDNKQLKKLILNKIDSFRGKSAFTTVDKGEQYRMAMTPEYKCSSLYELVSSFCKRVDNKNNSVAFIYTSMADSNRDTELIRTRCNINVTTFNTTDVEFDAATDNGIKIYHLPGISVDVTDEAAYNLKLYNPSISTNTYTILKFDRDEWDFTEGYEMI